MIALERDWFVAYRAASLFMFTNETQRSCYRLSLQTVLSLLKYLPCCHQPESRTIFHGRLNFTDHYCIHTLQVQVFKAIKTPQMLARFLTAHSMDLHKLVPFPPPPLSLPSKTFLLAPSGILLRKIKPGYSRRSTP
jgi:hypothetical protein